ncbi:MAG TPA: copper chaperone PCu(A)C [Steroidobacteraceae bacterium]|nr:copper chaperone PCu(A)C [Steroidobacteraceae bacterium]
MTQWHSRLVAVFFAVLSVSACERRAALEVRDARSGALPPTATVGAAYMTIKSSTPDELLAAETPIAQSVEFHTTQNADGMMQMRELPHVAIGAGEPFKFSPGANHMMLMGLRQPLVAGSTFPMTLHFKQAGAIAVTVEVRNDPGE